MDLTSHDPDTSVSEYLMKQCSSEKRIKHYSNLHQILLVGEGDFSFSLALANAFGSAKNMVPTSLDSREKVESSYTSGKTNLQALKKAGAKIFHGVDAKTMDKRVIIKLRKFDRIVFNFPHAGFFGKETDEKVIKTHRHLVGMFFKNASVMLSTMGEIHVSHKECYPYNEWKLVEQAQNYGLALKESVIFKIEDYPGYTNRRGAGSNIGDTFNLGNCKTYMFIQRESVATAVPFPELYPKAQAESLEEAILELESEILSMKEAETEKQHWKASFNHLKILADKVIKEKDEYKRRADDALLQRNEAWREMVSITNELTKALILKMDMINRKDVSLKKAHLELQCERQRLKAAETAKADLEASFEQYKLSIYKELKTMNQLPRQRDDALDLKEEVCREITITAKQMDEAFGPHKDENGNMDKDGKNHIHSWWKSFLKWPLKQLVLFCCNFEDSDMENRLLF